MGLGVGFGVGFAVGFGVDTEIGDEVGTETGDGVDGENGGIGEASPQSPRHRGCSRLHGHHLYPCWQRLQ